MNSMFVRRISALLLALLPYLTVNSQIDTLHYFDFSNGIPSNWGNQGQPSTALWEYRGPSTTPDNTVGSRGVYNSGTGVISSLTASNGFVIFDSDYLDNWGIPNNMGGGPAPVPHIGMLKTNILDFSNEPDVNLGFHSYFRTFLGEAKVLFSTNGGITFPDTMEFHAELSLNESSEADVSFSVPVGSYIGNDSNAVVAFFFDGRPGNSNGNGYYFWQIDDVMFSRTPDFELAMDSLQFGFRDKIGVYGMVPQQFLDSVTVEARLKNKGVKQATNTTIDVFRDSTLYSTSSISNLSSLTHAWLSSDFYPDTTLGVHQYEVNLDYDSVNQDLDTTNNSQIIEFSVNDSLYALDHGEISRYMGTNTWTSLSQVISADGFQMMNLFEFDQSAIINDMYVKLSPLTQPGGEVRVLVFDTADAVFGSGNGFTKNVYSSSFYTITGSDVANERLRLPINKQFAAGGYYFAIECYSHGGMDTIRVAIDESVKQHPLASICYINHPQFSGILDNPNAFHIRVSLGNKIVNTVQHSICQGDSIYLAGKYRFNSGIYSDTVTTSGGFDSIVHNNLSVHSAYSNQYSESMCSNESITLPWGNTVSTAGLYSHTYTTQHGCDSVIDVQVSIESINDSVVLIDNNLIAAAQGAAQYQWLECNNGSYTAIPNGNQQNFVPPSSGAYAVAISDNNCSDTSSCYQYTKSGIDDAKEDKNLSVIPNPNKGKFNLLFEKNSDETQVTIRDVRGKVVMRSTVVNQNKVEINLGHPPGVYYLTATNARFQRTIKLVKE